MQSKLDRPRAPLAQESEVPQDCWADALGATLGVRQVHSCGHDMVYDLTVLSCRRVYRAEGGSDRTSLATAEDSSSLTLDRRILSR